MKSPKIVTILKTFSKPELKEFEKFLCSPYHNNGRNFKPLFTLLRKYHPEFPQEKLSDEIIYKKIYPGKRFDKKRSSAVIRVLLSQAANMAEKFLKQICSNSGAAKKYSEVGYLSILKERKLDTLFEKHYENLDEIIGIKIDQDACIYSLLSQKEKEMCNYLLDRDRQQETSGFLIKQGEYLLSYFLTELFKIRAHYRTNEIVYNADFKDNIIKEVLESFNFKRILDYMKEKSFDSYIVLAIYYNSMMAQLDLNEDSYFMDFRDLFEENLHLFNRVERGSLFTDLEASCWKRLNSGIENRRREFFKKELFEIYKRKVKTGNIKLRDNDFMRLHEFRNILIAALNMREFEWLENFAKKHCKELAPEYSENMYNYSMAIVQFGRGNFESSLKLMSNVKYDYFYLRIDVKNWMLQCYYELNHFEQAYSLIDSYRHFLAKNKTVSELFKKLNSDFLNCYVNLIRVKNGDTTINLFKIKKDVSGASHFIHKGWILRKITELEKVAD